MVPDEVVVGIFPNGSSALVLEVFGKSQGFPVLTRIEYAAGKVIAFNVGRAFTQQFNQFWQFAIDGFELRPRKMAAFVVLSAILNLDVLPSDTFQVSLISPILP